MTRDEMIEAMAKAMAEAENDYAVDELVFTPYMGDATAALSAIEAAGFAIVPVVPSEGIELAGLNASDGWIDLSDAEIIYSAMIQAAKDEMK
jgi:UDP:flavonoid glycosyltransferase YjiC (YdhE family)